MTTVFATLTACGDRAPEQAALPELPELPTQQGGSTSAASHVGHGTLNSIDRDAGTANISHEAVTSAGWPAMTMNFKLADPAAVPELAPGQRVEFSFTTDGGGTVTRIAAVE
jgi:Cu(I)/Ag(I) efflux system membrane fusion protein